MFFINKKYIFFKFIKNKSYIKINYIIFNII